MQFLQLSEGGRVGVDAVLAAIRRGVALERSVAATRRWAAIDRVIAPGARNIAGELCGEWCVDRQVGTVVYSYC